MKVLVNISRLFVGILFIISGLIKLNDPVGFSFKLKDYFAPEVLNLEFLVPYVLIMAIFIVIFEVLVGIMILIGYAKKFTLWSLLLMIVFFTFLTFYSAYFNKVTDCGCFGDAIKLTPWESFTKDIILLVFVLILYFGRKHIQPFFSKNIRSIIVFAGFVFCLAITYHVLLHLPIIDFRPYKIDADITEGMSVPEDAPKPIFSYDWKFNVNGEDKIFSTSGDYPKVDGEFISVDTKELQAGYEPPIHDFTIEREDQDYTERFLNEENLIVVIAYSLSATEKDGYANIRQITDEAVKKGYKVIGLSASSQKVMDALADDYKLNFKFYFCDETTLKTIVRSNPGILELQSGTIKQKLHWNDALKMKLVQLENASPELDMNLKRRLDSIAVLDQRYRTLMQATSVEERNKIAEEMGLEPADYSGDLTAMQQVIDSSNMEFVEHIFKTRGYPGKSVVGEESSLAAWYVLQHNPDKIPAYLPLIKDAADAGEISKRSAAMMEDRYLMHEGEPQVYGTQGMKYDDARGSFIWPIINPETVNQRRSEAGFDQTIEEYSKLLFGDNFEYKVLTVDDVKEK
ncbi:BT_3928 family protein [Ulvibacter antarcticus]|uniref:Putative membrane protein YphA (DoxX/SURF4 family) n=1 Tax=Ulvibacter antarcticus TaxID=442714 RepID=A0A3L9YAS5_9FLAO|nr:BT_3928 family protein [Ulvibacter antarcticus]RMA57833.1 putative membrane protein YphA (DoxX/SURF4 family) [Ulvibacter antarcticus]